MKPHFHKVPQSIQTSFSIRHDVEPNFGTIWHYHPELELHYIIRGEGVRFTGDKISNFSAGEMILLGENMPHTWHCKEEYFEEGSNKRVEAIVLQFLPNCMGSDFLFLPEAHLLLKLFEKAKKGMVIHGDTHKKLSGLLFQMVNAERLEKVVMLLSILNLLSETEDYTFISATYSFHPPDKQEKDRLNAVYNYTLSNFKQAITLEEIAAISNLTVTSFCRYFKLMTHKTYYDFLTEVRISHVCQHLIEDKLSIPHISSQCGFLNISNFYRQFKKVTGLTPVNYKRNYLQVKTFS
ncbi:AraC family transcriptional regulator [Chitinophaga sp. MM2321]|uniref:AraC family transcriptional regulator n=1 Tax=Chitinophaga sp. MM2321 TaxID=3137178 RepID=UPI0032D58191